MTSPTQRRHEEIVALLTEIRDLLPERVEARVAPFDLDVIAANLEAIKHEIETPMRGHGECCDPAPADDLPGEPVEPGDLRAGDRVGLTFMGERITCTLVSVREGAILRSDTPDKDDYYPNVVVQGKWCSAISDVRLIERAPREDEDPDEALAKVLEDVDLSGVPGGYLPLARAAREHISRNQPVDASPLLEREREEQRERAEKAEAERGEWQAKFEQTDNLLSRTRDERDIALANQEAAGEALGEELARSQALEAKHAALREDVERGAHYWNSYESSGKHTQNVARAAGYDLTAYLDRDDERGGDSE